MTDFDPPDIESLWREQLRSLLLERGVPEDEVEAIVDHFWAESRRIVAEARAREAP